MAQIGLQGEWSCEYVGDRIALRRTRVMVSWNEVDSALPRLVSAAGAGVWSLAILVLFLD